MSPQHTSPQHTSPRHRPRLLAASAALLILTVSACTPAEQGGATTLPPTLPAFTTTSPSTTSPTAQAVDYGRLLLTAADLSDAEDTFNERSREAPPGGVPGASAFFVNNEDTRAISDTVLVYPDAATATSTLKQAAGNLSASVTGGTPKPAGVGADSVVVSGTKPDEAKAVTLLMFTQGRALVRLEFQSAQGDATTDGFVTSIGKMQQIALRIGLPDGE